MPFSEKILGVKYEIENRRSAFPISRTSDGISRIDVLACSLRYQHQWKYSPDGLSFEGGERIFSELLSNSGETWVMRYAGKIIAPDLDRGRVDQIYQFRDYEVSCGIQVTNRNDRILRGPRMFNKPQVDFLFDGAEKFELEFKVTGWPGNFSGSEKVLVEGKEVFNLNFEGGFESNLPSRPKLS